jgi:PiT family inorganic phosphate transporter
LVGLGFALLLAFGFEVINGFHDTANAVATVIYTQTLPGTIAVVWSGLMNFLGVLLSSGAVAFTIVALLPVELIIHAGSGPGYAMVFAMLASRSPGISRHGGAVSRLRVRTPLSVRSSVSV